ncbi:hypothetical protein [Brevibacterium yomogidense]|nr:hypothetical protein [Brevibacterium yomogidense]
MDTPENRLKLVYCHAHLGQFNGVDSRLAAARKRYPQNEAIAEAQAERFMMLEEYSKALKFWQKSAELMQKDSTVNGTVRGFPLRGTVFSWHEFAWSEIAENWEQLWRAAGVKPTAVTYQRTIQTLVSTGELPLAAELSLAALAQHPNSSKLSVQANETVLRRSSGKGSAALIELLRLGGDPVGADRIRREIASSETVNADIRKIGSPARDEFRILTVYRNTGADFSIRSGNFWDERRIHEMALHLAKRDNWSEQTAETDLLSQRAWAEATKFAAPRATAVGVNSSALARAVFHFFKQELTQKIPVDRIADEIARTGSEDPIYLDLGSLKIPYMVSYPSSRMQTLYFYSALRKRGCNVTLVRFPRRPVLEKQGLLRKLEPQPTPMPAAVFVPQPAQLKPPSRPLKPVKGNPGAIVVPAGIRSVSQVLSRVGDAVVVNSGSAVKGLAYDRSSEQNWDYDVNISMHSKEKGLLPTFRIPTTIVRTWRENEGRLSGTAAAPSNVEPIQAFLSSGKWSTGDWHSWMERAIVPYFRDFVKRVRTTLQDEAIMDVHISDYLYAESALIAQKVKDRGGRVHVWPHSTNPVHVDFHDPAYIKSIHAVTRSGAASWRERFPNAEVSHDSELMLAPQVTPIPFRDSSPISVVVIGGRPVMRNLPILDIAAHESLYREFFSGMDGLVQDGRIKVYFKPRGRTGEHEGWLKTVVGRTANWGCVLEHPLRMNLPNPVFVSLSVGSSALLEGTMRGIPGFIVREGFARDYLATEEGVFDTLTVPAALARLRRFGDAGDWESTRDRQMASLASDLAGHRHAR